MLTLAARDGVQFSGPAIGIIILVFLVGGYLWGTASWWLFRLIKQVACALRSRR
jgi:hypothetical protein